MIVEEAKALVRKIDAERLRLSGLSWDIEQLLHNLRHAEIGASGIAHRIIGDKEALLAQLQIAVDKTKEVL